MTKKLYPTDVVEQAQAVLSAWKEIDSGLVIGSLTPAMLEEGILAAANLEDEMARIEAQLTDKRNQRDALYCETWDKVKRARTGVKAIYGDDSSQYEMIGGTRRSERKVPIRKRLPPQ